MSANIAKRNSSKIYTSKPPHNRTAARAAWEMITNTTGKEIITMMLQNGKWRVTFSDDMWGEFDHTSGMTRQSIRQARAADRLRKAVEAEKAELESDPGYVIENGTIELVH